MRTLFILLLASSILANAQAQSEPPTATDAAKITFDTDLHDYGTIAYRANGECTFKYINTGNAALVVTGCKSSCGCVVASCDREPLLPGGSSVVRVKYDTNRPGPFTKTVTVESNAVNAPVLILRIKGYVLPPVGPGPLDTARHTEH